MQGVTKAKYYGRRKKKYDKEFKLKVVEISFTRGNVKDVAEEYGIEAQQLSIWRHQYKNHKEVAFPGNENKKQTEEEKKVAKLERELRDMTMERDILKKAIIIFSKAIRRKSTAFDEVWISFDSC